MPLRSRSYYFKILPNIYLWKHSKQCSKNLSCSSLSNVRSTQVLTWWSTRGSKMCWAQPWKIRSHTRVYLMKVKVAQSCPTLYNSMDYTVYGILQARILEWVAFPFSRGSSEPWGRRQVFCIAGRLLTSWATREIPSPKDLPNPGMEPGSPALQANSLVTEILWKPN